MNAKLNEISKIAYSFTETVYHSYQAAKEMIEKGISGTFVECGVAAGAQIAAMQLAVIETTGGVGPIASRVTRRIFAFDSYQGIPLAGPHDTEQPGIGAITHDVDLPLKDRLCSSGQTVHSIENVKANFFNLGLPVDNIAFIKGWFQDTLPFYTNAVGPIALLRLDGDLYESTECCMEELYPNVTKGGMIIIDDFALAGCRKAVLDYFNYKSPEPKPFFQEVPGGRGPVFFYRN